ncbi:hypothetical protein EVAR_39146_1 [Eumeta japonica]|uniref:Uncharacterized protein n=1 Tax=Eumeta variegata TaxID=151549 RepID=A0A4C1X5L7_EUMVA|nr:hypothetical protein EVAR_39146_1 [Eumeta japonica]
MHAPLMLSYHFQFEGLKVFSSAVMENFKDVTSSCLTPLCTAFYLKLSSTKILMVESTAPSLRPPVPAPADPSGATASARSCHIWDSSRGMSRIARGGRVSRLFADNKARPLKSLSLAGRCVAAVPTS